MSPFLIANPNRIPLYSDEHLALDFDRQFLMLNGRRVPLTRKEYELLALMIQYAGEIIPREALLLQVWGYRPDIRTRTLDVHVRRLRKKLDRSARCIETIVGIGYRFQPFQASRYFRGPVIDPAVGIGA